jgi:DNA-binding NarL/FixJ family response regulator
MVRNILFADGDTILCDAVKNSLASYHESFTVVTACDGFDAVKQLKKIPVSLIILELVMPRMDGMSLISHLRDNYPDVPAIIISSMDDAHLHEIATKNNLAGYLKKPLRTEKLVSTINSLLQKEAAGGIMHDISPTVFLQFMEMDAKSCTIRILDNTTHQGGILYFKEGELLDVRIGNLSGIEAAYELFSWDTATVFMRNECELRKNNINSPLTPIIMKAVGMKDESLQPDDASPSDHRETPNTTQPGLSGSARIELLKNTLGQKLGLQKCFHDPQAKRAVDQLNELGKNNGFGEFRFAYLNADGHVKIVLSGQPPTVLDVAPTCNSDEIIDLLQT